MPAKIDGVRCRHLLCRCPARWGRPRLTHEGLRGSEPRREGLAYPRGPRASPCGPRTLEPSGPVPSPSPHRDARLRVRGRVLYAGPRERARPRRGRELLAVAEARAGVRREVADSCVLVPARADHRPRRHRPLRHRAPERGASAGQPRAVARTKASGLHEAAWPQRPRGEGDAHSGTAIGCDARVCRDRSLRSRRRQGAGHCRVRRHRARAVGAVARIAQRSTQPALLGYPEDGRRRAERSRMSHDRGRTSALRQSPTGSSK